MKELDNYTKDELNDFAAVHMPELEIKGRWNKKKIIKEISNYAEQNDIDLFDSDNIPVEEEDKNIIEEDKEELTYSLLDDDNEEDFGIKCHRCGSIMKLIDEVNNDYLCPKCKAGTTIMRD